MVVTTAEIFTVKNEIIRSSCIAATWLETSHDILFTDSFRTKVFKLNADTNYLDEKFISGRGLLSTVYPTDKVDEFVALSWLEIIRFDWPGKDSNYDIIGEFSDDGKVTMPSHGKADRNGNFWFGTYCVSYGDEFIVEENMGSLYQGKFADEETELKRKYKSKNGSQQVKSSLRQPAGIEWSLNSETMFVCDPQTGLIQCYRSRDDELSKMVPLVDFNDLKIECYGKPFAQPASVAIDVDSRLWVTFRNSPQICCFDSLTGKLVDQLSLENSKCNMACVFGGSYLNQLFIVSSPGPFDMTGSIYRVDGLQAKGVQAPKVTHSETIF